MTPEQKAARELQGAAPTGAYLCESAELNARYWLEGARNARNNGDANNAVLYAEQAINAWKNLAYSLAVKAHYYLIQSGQGDLPPDYKKWYDEAMRASNAAGYVGLSAAQTIEEMDKRLRASESAAPSAGETPETNALRQPHAIKYPEMGMAASLLQEYDDLCASLERRLREAEEDLRVSRGLAHMAYDQRDKAFEAQNRAEQQRDDERIVLLRRARTAEAEVRELRELIDLIFASTHPYLNDGSPTFSDKVTDKWAEIEVRK